MKHQSILRALSKEDIEPNVRLRRITTLKGMVDVLEYFVISNGYEMTWSLTGGDSEEATNLRIRNLKDEPDVNTDYYPYWHPKTLKIAINWIKGD